MNIINMNGRLTVPMVWNLNWKLSVDENYSIMITDEFEKMVKGFFKKYGIENLDTIAILFAKKILIE